MRRLAWLLFYRYTGSGLFLFPTVCAVRWVSKLFLITGVLRRSLGTSRADSGMPKKGKHNERQNTMKFSNLETQLDDLDQTLAEIQSESNKLLEKLSNFLGGSHE